MSKGVIKYYNEEKGYGFIAQEGEGRMCSCIAPQSLGSMTNQGLAKGYDST